MGKSNSWKTALSQLILLLILCLSHIQPWAPYDFYHPCDFLSVRLSEAAVGILCRCCSHRHNRLRTAWHVYSFLWFGWIIRRSYGVRTRLFVTPKRAVRRPYQYGGQNSNGTTWAHVGPVSGRAIFVKNSPGTARTGPGVWCDWGITNASNNFIKALDISHKSFYSMSKAGNIISRVY